MADAKTIARRRKLGLLTMRVFNSMQEADDYDRKYWWAQTPAARLRAAERLRQLNYGYGKGRPLPRFQRTLRVIELGER
jgi:hypothetical protein